MARTSAPQFVLLGGRLINTDQIKWAGMNKARDDDEPRLYIEFITGGFIRCEPGVTLRSLQSALTGDPY